MPTTLSVPWHAFLAELDQLLDQVVVVPFCGGFAMTQFYGMERMTDDLDVLDVAPHHATARLLELAGRGSELSQKHHLYVHYAGVVQPPYEFESRLQPAFEGVFEHLHLHAMDPYDVVLTKLPRDSERDLGDFLYLAKALVLDMATLRQRYQEELRPYLHGDKQGPDFTLDAWMESYEQTGT